MDAVRSICAQDFEQAQASASRRSFAKEKEREKLSLVRSSVIYICRMAVELPMY
jgi:hypothetical protein